jgi:hypothetical protein
MCVQKNGAGPAPLPGFDLDRTSRLRYEQTPGLTVAVIAFAAELKDFGQPRNPGDAAHALHRDAHRPAARQALDLSRAPAAR